MSPRPDLGPRPALGYIASRLDRAVLSRGDDAALKRFCEHAQAASYVIGGELVVLKAGEPCDPLFTLREARGLGSVREIIFLGLADTAPRFGFAMILRSPICGRLRCKPWWLRIICRHWPKLKRCSAGMRVTGSARIAARLPR